MTVYDNLSRSMIQTDTKRAGVSSHDKLKANADGSIDVYFGPEGAARAREQLDQDAFGEGLVCLLPLVQSDRGVLR